MGSRHDTFYRYSRLVSTLNCCLEMHLLEEKALYVLDDFGSETRPTKCRAFVVGVWFQQEIVLASGVNVGSDFGVDAIVGVVEWDG